MQKIIYLILLSSTYIGIDAAARPADRTHSFDIHNVNPESALELFLNNSTHFERLISAKVSDRETCIQQQNLRTSFTAQLKTKTGSYRFKALVCAYCRNMPIAAKYILEAGARVNGETPLSLAVKQGSIQLMETLLRSGADVSQIPDEEIQQTPLYLATLNGNEEKVALLLKYGAAPSAPDRDGMTPLHFAAMNKHSAIITTLMQYGANKHALNNAHESPLLYAVRSNDEASVQALLETGQLCSSSSSTEIDLINPSINRPNINGHNPLMMATFVGNSSIFSSLIRAGASIGAMNTCDDIHYQSVLSALAESSADTSAILTICKQLISPELCQQLADVPNKDGNYPIHTACTRGKLDLLQFLLDSNVKVHVKNATGEWPFSIAAKMGNAEVMIMLAEQKLKNSPAILQELKNERAVYLDREQSRS